MIATSDALHVEERGEGPPLVLAHGFSGSARNWGPQVRAFRDRYRVVTFDLRGHARSAAPHARPDLYQPECFVADLASVLDRCGAARAVVGGLSLGAAASLAFAHAHPERVRALVLASLPGGPDSGGVFAGRAEEMARVLEEEGSEAAGARFVWGPSSGLDERGAALVRQGFLEHDPLGLAQVLREALPTLAEAVAMPGLEATLTMPVLLVAGDRDEASRAATHRLAERLPHAQVCVLENAGHVVNLAAPKAFSGVLDAFLASLPPESEGAAGPDG